MRFLAVMAAMLALAAPLAAQGSADAQAAEAAMQQLDYAAAIRLAKSVLAAHPTRDDRVAMTRLLGFAYGALDSTRQAVAAFRDLIFLAPNDEPDVSTVSPRITSLYASALGQVLVVRHVRLDGASFTAGRGGAVLRYDVSRPARVVTRATGPAGDFAVDSSSVSGSGIVTWKALDASGRPLPAGRYQLVITATEGANAYSAETIADVAHGAVDTLDQLTHLPGYDELPETVSATRTFRPLALGALFSGVATGASLALENTAVGGGERREVAVVSVVALGVGLIASLVKPDPKPVEANIRYNRLLREQLAARNATIAAQNEARRREVRLIVTPVKAPS
jgi:hypothetical protein